MADRIKTASEWVQQPSYHGSYDDYVRHMRGMAAQDARQAEDRLADKIATALAAKLRA